MMKHPLFVFLLFAVTVLLFSTCVGKDEHYSVLPDSVKLKEGDLVFRLGTSFESEMVVAADRNGLYSHCGIVVDSAGVMMIVHAVPDELDSPEDIERVKMDDPDVFFRADRAKAGAVCRVDDSIAAHRAAQSAKAAYLRRTPFDNNFDDKDTTKLYCSELVWRSFKNAGYDLVGSERYSYNAIVMSFDNCIMPSQIYNSNYVHPIALFTDL